MANTFKNSFVENVSNNATYASQSTLVTCPTGNASKCVVIGMQLANKSASEITVTIGVKDNSAATNSDITFLNAVPIPANSVLSVLQGDKLILEETDNLHAYASAASACNAFVNYLLIDNT